MEQSLLSRHGLGQLGRLGNAMPVLERPHTLQVKERHAVSIPEKVVEVRLKAGHGTEVAVDERDATLLGGQSQMREEITQAAPGRQFNV